MKWLYFILAIAVFTHFFRSISVSLLVLQAKRFNRYPTLVNVLLVWLVPFYWATKVQDEIEKNQEVETNYWVNGDGGTDPFDLLD